MSTSVLGKVTCVACGSAMFISEGKAGSLSGHCPSSNGCGATLFLKSPKSAAAMRVRLGGAPASPAPASSSPAPAAAKKPGWFDDLGI